MANIISSITPNNWTDAAIVAGTAVTAPFWGAYSIIPGVGLYLAKKGMQTRENAQVLTPEQPFVFAPLAVGKPIDLGHGPNTCFLAGMLWGLFLNEPLFLDALLDAIRLRMHSLNLPEKKAGYLRTLLCGKQMSWNDIKNGPYSFETKCRFIKHELDKRESANENFPPNSKEMLSLLELADFFKTCQGSTRMDPNQVQALRKTLHRLVPDNFSKNGSEQCDSYEAFMTLADVIFAGSPANQNFTTRRNLECNRETRALEGSELNWGRLELEVQKEGTVGNTLLSMLSTNRGELELDRKIYRVRNETRKFDHAPPVLVLNIKRFRYVNGIIQKITQNFPAEEFLDLPGGYFENDPQGGRYQLMSVVNHAGEYGNGHYTAQVNRQGTYYSCDDTALMGVTNRENFAKAAAAGYILVYRKMGNAQPKPVEKPASSCLIC